MVSFSIGFYLFFIKKFDHFPPKLLNNCPPFGVYLYAPLFSKWKSGFFVLINRISPFSIVHFGALVVKARENIGLFVRPDAHAEIIGKDAAFVLIDPCINSDDIFFLRYLFIILAFNCLLNHFA